MTRAKPASNLLSPVTSIASVAPYLNAHHYLGDATLAASEAGS